MNRHGKIARMPETVRAVINQSLENHSDTEAILAWLNKEPEARKVLDQWFDGEPVSKQNLSQWRRGGFREWQQLEAACDLVRGLVDESRALDREARQEEDDMRLSDRLSLVMMAKLIEAARTLMKEARTSRQRWKRLQEVFALLNRVRSMDMRAQRLHLAEMNYMVKMKMMEKELRGEQAVAPVLNLMAEESVRRAMAMGPNYNKRAKEILDRYFRSGEKPAEETGSRRREEAGGETGSLQGEEPSEETRSRRRKEAGSGNSSRQADKPVMEKDQAKDDEQGHESARSSATTRAKRGPGHPCRRRRNRKVEKRGEADKRKRSNQHQKMEETRETDAVATPVAPVSDDGYAPTNPTTTPENVKSAVEMEAGGASSEVVPAEQVPTNSPANDEGLSKPVKVSQSKNETAGEPVKEPAVEPTPMTQEDAAAMITARDSWGRLLDVPESPRGPILPWSPPY